MTVDVHIMNLILREDGDMENVKVLLPYAILPDVLGKCLASNVPSHFLRQGAEDASWLKYPKNLKTINGTSEGLEFKNNSNKDDLSIYGNSDFSLAKDCMTDMTNYGRVAAFVHILEDQIFTKFVSHMLADDYAADGKDIKNISVFDVCECKLVLENRCHLALARQIYEQYGILCTQEYLRNLVKESVEKVYSEEMANYAMRLTGVAKDTVQERVRTEKFEAGLSSCPEVAKIFAGIKSTLKIAIK